MASWGTLRNIFENPSQDSLSSWAQLLPKAETEASFDMFGEICRHVKPVSSPSHSPPPPPPVLLPSNPKPRLETSSSWNCTVSDADDNAFEIFGELCYKTQLPEPIPNSPEKSENLDHRTKGGDDDRANDCKKKVMCCARSYSDVRSRCNSGLFPPPLTSFGGSGKPRVYFKSFRQDGRFVLREVRIPTQRLLHARREDGRLTMQVVSPVKDTVRKLEIGEAENAEGEVGTGCESAT